jgi:DNA uptake protein ComE-like DNA-binding protein
MTRSVTDHTNVVAMPTPAERKALLFLAGVIVLGASVRVVRAARSGEPVDAASRQALARQLASVDSARDGAPRRASRGERERSHTKKRRSDTRRLPSLSRADSIAAADSARGWVREPLSRSIDNESVSSPSTPRSVPIDLDVATETEIESLPRIGPVLARRIVADRTANGPFGSMAGFERVVGVGPSLAASLAQRVTFSGTARPPNAVADNRLRSNSPHSKSPRRERKK